MSDHPSADQEPLVPLDLPPEVPEADAIEQRRSRPGEPDEPPTTGIVHDADDRPVDLDENVELDENVDREENLRTETDQDMA